MAVKKIKTRKAMKPVSIGKTQRKSLLGFFGNTSGYSYDKEVKSKEINGQNITFYSKKALDSHAKTYPKAWAEHGSHYTKITPKWYINTAYMTNGAWAKLSGINVFDWAVPWEWQKQHQSEMNKRGGAVWWYDKDERWGEPLYMDDIKAMAMKNLKAHVPK